MGERRDTDVSLLSKYVLNDNGIYKYIYIYSSQSFTPDTAYASLVTFAIHTHTTHRGFALSFADRTLHYRLVTASECNSEEMCSITTTIVVRESLFVR